MTTIAGRARLASLALWLLLDSPLFSSAAPPDAPPKKSPRLGLIAFSSDRSGSWRIWVVKEDGSGARRISAEEAAGDDVDPGFSPDGAWILFTSTRGGKAGVWRARADGTGPERLCDGDQAEWAPDGKTIAFRRDEKLFVRELATGQERRIAPADFPHPSGPSFSPDGSTIAFACRWDAGNALFTVPAAGGEPRRVYDKRGACEPHWSPDGKLLVYETETHLACIKPDGTGNRPLTFFGGVQRYGRFSPDGTEIVFCQGPTPRGPFELYVIPAAGGSPRRLTEGGSDMYPDWR